MQARYMVHVQTMAQTTARCLRTRYAYILTLFPMEDRRRLGR